MLFRMPGTPCLHFLPNPSNSTKVSSAPVVVVMACAGTAAADPGIALAPLVFPPSCKARVRCIWHVNGRHRRNRHTPTGQPAAVQSEPPLPPVQQV